MDGLKLEEFQKYLTVKYKEGHTSSGLFMKLVEEIGEVAEVINQLEGRKTKNNQMSLEAELADVLHYAVAIASLNNIDLSKAIIEKDKIAAIKYNHSPNLKEFLEINKNI
ncbi:MazG nucleotide pyrophosphohydrolase domain-containing protein [Alkalibacterium olivapovliticus]|uniref:MazG-like nucleotide pyrophosphohydrolase family protein n=1 Tax=Alkalibacterium olivapovliticus TaxID=99907 RepID=A0A2T0W3M4_9LACT|nr:MazG nucleotide pyrophosphohydrolase domain-containing protein [Alkalibacterium olivapovliticus]PRY80079.1 MazG-like nucleotide pyrophosphohydrolase family protein [Alkalibacterium olivapovliticus]